MATVVAAAQAHHDAQSPGSEQPASSMSVTFGDGAGPLWRETIAALAERGLIVAVNGRDFHAVGVGTTSTGEGCLQVEGIDETSDRLDGTGELFEIPWPEVESFHVY